MKKIKFILITFSLLMIVDVKITYASINAKDYFKDLPYENLVKGNVTSFDELKGKPSIFVFGRTICGRTISVTDLINELIDTYKIHDEINVIYFSDYGLGDPTITIQDIEKYATDKGHENINIYHYYFWQETWEAMYALGVSETGGTAWVYYFDKYGDSVVVTTATSGFTWDYHYDENGELLYLDNKRPNIEVVSNFFQSLGIDETMLGDTNQDGKISLVDVSTAYAHYRGAIDVNGLDKMLSDYNQDGKVSVQDTALIYQKYRNK